MKTTVKAQVVYDSARAPEVTGLRGGPGSDRSLIFLARSLSLDLMVHTRPGEDYCYLCGQVMDEKQLDPIPGVKVQVGEENASTDVFGQFSLGGMWPPENRTVTVVGEEIDVVCRIPEVV
jgi:hypothetical protein